MSGTWPATASTASATISRVAAGVTVNDFSTRIALPAASAARATARCCGCGVATYTTSTPGSPTSPRYDPYAAGARPGPAAAVISAANADARSADRDPTAAPTAPGTRA